MSESLTVPISVMPVSGATSDSKSLLSLLDSLCLVAALNSGQLGRICPALRQL